MKIKDQIRARRDKLGLTMKELADRVGVSEQAVRHWESGRSFPGKSKMRLVEEALTFTLDWTEGAATGNSRTAAAMIDQGDVELLLVICKLPAKAKNLIGEFARMHAEVVEQARGNAPGEPPAPPKPISKSTSRVAAKAAPAPAPALVGGGKRH